jgi:hypothetical protein
MTYRILYGARQDALAAEARLEREHPGYGDAFADEFVAAVRAVLDRPRLHPPAADAPPGYEVREHLIRRFNYRVIYAILDDEILFVTVVHAHRRPRSWHRRLRDLN